MSRTEPPSESVHELLNAAAGTMYAGKLGIVMQECTGDRVVATMPVEGNTQPDGFLHGGATTSLVETIASVGAALRAGWPERLVVGLQQTCSFLSTATSGTVRGVAVPLHTGRTIQVWDVDVVSVETGRRIASGRLTLAVRDRRGPPASPGGSDGGEPGQGPRIRDVPA